MGVSSTRDRPFWDKNKPEPSYTRCLRRMLKSRKKKRVFCTAPTRRKQNIRRPEGTPRQMCSQLHTVVHSQLQSNIHWPSSGELVFKQSIRSSRHTGSILQEENKIFLMPTAYPCKFGLPALAGTKRIGGLTTRNSMCVRCDARRGAGRIWSWSGRPERRNWTRAESKGSSLAQSQPSPDLSCVPSHFVCVVSRAHWHVLGTGTVMRLPVQGERELSRVSSRENRKKTKTPELTETKSHCG